MSASVIVKLMGGLGNQMLQYAAGYSLSKRKNARLRLDASYFSIDHKINNTHREFELGIFGLAYQPTRTLLTNRIVQAAVLKLPLLRNGLLPGVGIRYLTDRNEFPRNGSFKTYFLDGYWTNLKYFDDYRTELSSVFNFAPVFNEANRALANKMSSENAVAVHVRRTDYLRPDSIHHVLSAEYFLAAIELIKARTENPVFYYFGDDHEWIRQSFPVNGVDHILVSHNNGNLSYNDMGLMTQCRHVIISNSTFSWWGAYLNNRGGMTICSDKWFREGQAGYFVYDEFIPSKWIRLKL